MLKGKKEEAKSSSLQYFAPQRSKERRSKVLCTYWYEDGEDRYFGLVLGSTKCNIMGYFDINIVGQGRTNCGLVEEKLFGKMEEESVRCKYSTFFIIRRTEAICIY